MHSLAFCIVVGAVIDHQGHRCVVGTTGARLAIRVAGLGCFSLFARNNYLAVLYVH